MIPCKEYKCLKYPACRNKTDIKCLSLLNYFTIKRNKLKHKYNFVVRHENTWLHIKNSLPNVLRIRGGDILQNEYKTGYKDTEFLMEFYNKENTCKH